MFKLIYALYKIKIFTPVGLFRVVSAVFNSGVNLMALLWFAAKTYPDKIVVIDENEKLSYKQLLIQSEKLSLIFKDRYKLKKGKRVGFLCKNHASMVKAVFSVSRTGADIYFLNAEMSTRQFNLLLNRYNFNFLIYDFELNLFVENSDYKNKKIASYHDVLPSVNTLLDLSINEKIKCKRSSAGKIVVLTGGTTGDFKTAFHKPSIFNFLNPFFALLLKLNLDKYSSIYVATPMYHGFGIAALLISVLLGVTMVMHKGFDAEKTCSLIKKYNIEVITLVPLILQKMLKKNAASLESLGCIITGGAMLNPKLVSETFNKLGDVLFNLYGTSEAGFSIMATPGDLKYSAKTIGKKIAGVNLKILDGNKITVSSGSVGQLCIKSNWSIKNSTGSYIETGDMGYVDENGYYFLCGRTDDMIVSAGENVYPVELENVLVDHSQVEDAAVIGISDESFGQRLKAFVQVTEGSDLNEEYLLEWLRSRVARYHMPKEIAFIDKLPYTVVGKVDKKNLKI